jgi:hypothetical protein
LPQFSQKYTERKTVAGNIKYYGEDSFSARFSKTSSPMPLDRALWAFRAPTIHCLLMVILEY